MHSTKPTPAISKYGIAHAPNLYTLAELVNHQIKKGFQPVGTVAAMDVGEEKMFVQTLVQYQTPKRLSGKQSTITKTK
jgi:hypothetical protein